MKTYLQIFRKLNSILKTILSLANDDQWQSPVLARERMQNTANFQDKKLEYPAVKFP